MRKLGHIEIYYLYRVTCLLCSGTKIQSQAVRYPSTQIGAGRKGVNPYSQCARSLETAVIRIDVVLAARKEEAVIEAKGADTDVALK